MTIVVVDVKNKTVYADRQASYNYAAIYPHSKFVKYNDRYWYIAAGDVVSANTVFCEFIACLEKQTKFILPFDCSVGGFIIDTETETLYEISTTTDSGDWVITTNAVRHDTSGYMLAGSGRSYFTSAIAAGNSVIEALQYTITYSSSCGGNIDSLTFDGVFTECLL